MKIKEQISQLSEHALKEIRVLTIIQLIYRTIACLWMITVYLEYFISKPEKFKTFLTFLTNQSFVLTNIYFFLGILSCIFILL
jgi:hypothetical protein